MAKSKRKKTRMTRCSLVFLIRMLKMRIHLIKCRNKIMISPNSINSIMNIRRKTQKSTLMEISRA